MTVQVETELNLSNSKPNLLFSDKHEVSDKTYPAFKSTTLNENFGMLCESRLENKDF